MSNFRYDRTPSIERVKYDLSNFVSIDGRVAQSSLNIKNGSYGYNIQLKGGIIQTGIGANEPRYHTGNGEFRVLPSLLPEGENIVRLHYYRASHLGGGSDRVVALGSEGGFYVCSLLTQDAFTPLSDLKGESGKDAIMINYYLDGVDTLLIFYSGGMATYDGDTLTKVESSPIMHSATMLYDRVFGVSDDKLYFSAPLNPTDFSVEGGGGYLSFMDEGGALKKIVTLGSELYLFREHSIYRLSVLGKPTDYHLERLVSLNYTLIPKTIQVAGDTIYFVMSNKLYSFDGITLREVLSGVMALVESTTHSVATYFDDIYYLSCALKTEGEKVGDEADLTVRYNNGVIYFDTLTGTIGIMRGVDIVGFFPVLTSVVKEIFLIYGNARSHRAGMLTDDGKIYGTSLKKLYRSSTSNLGDLMTLKNLRRMYVDSDYDLTLKVKQGGEEHQVKVVGKDNKALPFRSIGHDFCYELSADEDIFVKGVTLIFDKVRRYTA